MRLTVLPECVSFDKGSGLAVFDSTTVLPDVRSSYQPIMVPGAEEG